MDGEPLVYEIVSVTLVAIAGGLFVVSLVAMALLRRNRARRRPKRHSAVRQVREAALAVVADALEGRPNDGRALADAFAGVPRRGRIEALRRASDILSTVRVADGESIRLALVEGGVAGQLSRALGSRRSAARRRALLLAGDLGWIGGVAGARELLGVGDPEDVLAAAIYLDRVGAREPEAMLQGWRRMPSEGMRAVLGGLLARQGRDATRLLCGRAMDDADPAEIVLLRDCVADPVLPGTLAHLVLSRDPGVRMAAATVCRSHAPVGFADVARTALSDEQPGVRAAMVSTALIVGVGLADVEQVLDDPDPRVQQAAALALATTPLGWEVLDRRAGESAAVDLGRSLSLQRRRDRGALAAQLAESVRRRGGPVEGAPDFAALTVGRSIGTVRLSDVDGSA